MEKGKEAATDQNRKEEGLAAVKERENLGKKASQEKMKSIQQNRVLLTRELT